MQDLLARFEVHQPTARTVAAAPAPAGAARSTAIGSAATAAQSSAQSPASTGASSGVALPMLSNESQGEPMSADVSDNQLVQRVQQGDRRAFDLLVVKYQHKVLKLVGRLISNPAEAEDVAQEAFIKAYRALKSFRGDSAFYTWLYRIAINTAKNALVSQGRRPVDFNLDLQDPAHEMQSKLREGDTPEGMLLTDEIRLTVQQALQELPEDLRTAITLRELEGLSYEEIAEAMDCPVGTVRSRIFRAREAIDKKLQPLLD
jgi:RNA polymerase sigma-70 factor (ECF subfamily)